jgi:2-oxoglutarate ferredoxin oxidoreductase subunit beta
MREKEIRDDATLTLRHGQPLIFGKNHNKGIRVRGAIPEVVTIGENGVTEADILVHDEKGPAATAFLLSRLEPPGFPTPIGVFRSIDTPAYEKGINGQVEEMIARKGAGDLTDLLRAGDTWTVV